MALVLSSFRFKGSWVYIFNFIFLYFAFLCICAINFRWCGESLKILLLFFHPCYAIIPIILNILIYLSLCRYNNNNNNTLNYSNNNTNLDNDTKNNININKNSFHDEIVINVDKK